jgi:hypothetical protein
MSIQAYLSPHVLSTSTIIPMDMTQLSIMGQCTEISFYDAKAVNMAYCSSKRNKNTLSCLVCFYHLLLDTKRPCQYFFRSSTLT